MDKNILPKFKKYKIKNSNPIEICHFLNFINR
ncbi:MAG: hypothetical protein ACK42G_05620 [Candidatus Kapaibacteriota bacterium]